MNVHDVVDVACLYYEDKWSLTTRVGGVSRL